MRPFKPSPTELAPAVFLPEDQRRRYFKAGARITAGRVPAIAAGLTAAAGPAATTSPRPPKERKC